METAQNSAGLYQRRSSRLEIEILVNDWMNILHKRIWKYPIRRIARHKKSGAELRDWLWRGARRNWRLQRLDSEDGGLKITKSAQTKGNVSQKSAKGRRKLWSIINI